MIYIILCVEVLYVEGFFWYSEIIHRFLQKPAVLAQVPFFSSWILFSSITDWRKNPSPTQQLSLLSLTSGSKFLSRCRRFHYQFPVRDNDSFLMVVNYLQVVLLPCSVEPNNFADLTYFSVHEYMVTNRYSNYQRIPVVLCDANWNHSVCRAVFGIGYQSLVSVDKLFLVR